MAEVTPIKPKKAEVGSQGTPMLVGGRGVGLVVFTRLLVLARATAKSILGFDWGEIFVNYNDIITVIWRFLKLSDKILILSQ